MTFDEWLSETLDLQRSAFKTDPPTLSGEDRAEYLRWNVLAAKVELSEFLGEIRWKPWARDQGEIKDRSAAVEEIVDVMHFLANCLVTLEVDGDELSAGYRHKMQVNDDRQASGDYRG